MLLQHGPLVLYFYPADFTPVCTREAGLFRNAHAALADAGLTVAGISPDTVKSHLEFHSAHALPYVLLADTDKQVAKSYGVNGPLGLGVRRATFLIDPERTVKACVLADLRLGRHEAFIAEAITLSNATTGS